MNAPVSGNFKPYIEGLIEQKKSLGLSLQYFCPDTESL